MNSKENSTMNFMERLRARRSPAERKPVSIPPLADMLADLMKVKDADWGKYAFKREPLKARFDEAERMRLIEKANACGVEYARKLKEAYPGLSMLELAKELGLEVHFPEKPNGGGHIIFAQFVQPNQITVFNDSLKKAEDQIAENNLGEMFGGIAISEILLAHEIFHFVEEQNEKEIFTRTEKVNLWKIAAFKYTSKIVCLGEIAGMAFAKEMLGMTFSPYVLDSFLVYPYNQEISYYLYEEIMKIAGDMQELVYRS